MKRYLLDIPAIERLFHFYTLKIKTSYRLFAMALILFCCISGTVFSQQNLVNDAQRNKLNDFSVRLSTRFHSSYQRALLLAKIHNWPLTFRTKDGGLVSLQGVDSLGYPVYLITYDNIIAAATTGTNTVQPGGSLGLTLSGSSPNLANKLAEWDEGPVLTIHQEFAGKTITVYDGGTAADHSTHVAGTMIAKGVNPLAKGMAFNATTLHTYDFNNDVAEMSGAASGLLLSNHSYGSAAGWLFDTALNHWVWYGIPGDTEDFLFGFYSQKTQAFDQIAYNAPYYLIVEAAGNARTSNGPDVGADYWGYASATDQTIVDKGPRPAGISNNDSYDVISETGNAKNILTVGAVNGLPNGPASSADIVTAPFSSWGPTDDGRVKPDIVGDGVDVLSTSASSPTSYVSMSGTSMASPNVTGSLYLLQEYYAQLNGGAFMRSATLKALACHTAFDAGNPGPDYVYGWGLLNMKFAAQTISANGNQSIIKENTLSQGNTQTITVTASGTGPLAATICWTDPAGTPTASGTINDRTPKLVNDLDIRISDGTNTFYPWVLDPNNPSAPATKGDNIVDNVEQVLIPNPQVGVSYTITISHKGALQSGTQNYSLIVTGIGNTTYCASGALSTADSRIDNVTFSNINNTPPPGCVAYSNYTNLTAALGQGETYPLNLTLGTCGANFAKAAKVYIDWNADGIFEPNELVATSNVLTTTGTYQTNITVPASVVPGKTSLMRVVLEETTDLSVIQACGSYPKGETEDYSVQFTINTTLFPTIETGGVSGSISACAGTASVSPALQQFTIAGKFLQGSVTASALPGFEISLAPSGGFSSSLSIAESGGVLNTTTIYVRSAATAPPGNLSGGILLSTPGTASQEVVVNGTVNSLPVANAVQNQGPYIDGATTQAVNLDGTGLAYNWTNDTPGIGLPASGTGDIAAFKAVNKTAAPITATITVTPVPAPGFAYVANASSNDVSVINTVTNQVVTSIPVGQSPFWVAVSPNGSRVYVTNVESNDVSVIDALTNKVIDNIALNAQPAGIVVSPDNSKVYVCADNEVIVINTANDAIEGNITLDPDGADALALSPDGSKLFVMPGEGTTAYVINTAIDAIASKFTVGQAPWGAVVSPNGTLLYVANTFDNNIMVFDTQTMALKTTIPLATGPWGICLSPDGSQLYVADSGDNAGPLTPGALSVINTTTYQVIKTILIGQYPIGVSVTADGSKVFIADDFGNNSATEGTVSVVNTNSMALEGTVYVEANPISEGNFISGGTKCYGTPITFTITVDPTPVITTGAVTGNNTACSGSPSATPDIQQFTVSASGLPQNLTATAPTGFEVSLTPNIGYTNSVIITPNNGLINNVIVYVRLSASAMTGSNTGNVVLTSPGVASQNVAVSGIVVTQLDPGIQISTLSTNVCAGSSVIFTATPANEGSAPVYQWMINGNNAGTNQSTFTSNTLASGDVISCVLTSSASCAVPATATSNSLTMNVVALAADPSVSITSSSNPACQDSPVTFTATPANDTGTLSYQWLINGNDAGAANNPIFTTTKLNDGDVISCIMTSNGGCTIAVNSNSITTNVLPLPTANAGENQLISPAKSVQLNGTASADVVNIAWSPVTGLSNPAILNPVASPDITTTYTLTVQSPNGCTASSSLTITLIPPTLAVPNAFTPNGDGINDTWNIKYLDLYPNCTVRVYNRWGQGVFSSIGYGTPWNGTYNGRSLPTGTYYYVIDLKNNSKQLSGFVAIIR